MSEKSHTYFLVVIAGASGVGKSDLGIRLCQKFNGEIISADSIQIYRGLKVISNKVNEDDLKKFKHHMIDLIEIGDDFDVKKYRDLALPIINNNITNNKISFIVGGTNYYIESLIYNNLIETSPFQPNKYEDISNYELWRLLNTIDPDHARTLHHNDRRKILRSIQINSAGQLHSELINQQSMCQNTTNFPDLKFKNVLFLWLTADQENLNSLIRKRCKFMLNNGGWEELQFIYKKFTIAEFDENNLSGVFQAIGFKQFLPCLKLYPLGKYMDMDMSSLRETCFESFVTSTIRYTKKQNRWIRNRILLDNRIRTIKLNISENSADEIYNKCVQEIQYFFTNPSITSTKTSIIKKPVRYSCELCKKVAIGNSSWEAHIKSKQHRSLTRSQKSKKL
ncbi:hypothetical protein HZS_3899 [Henneguya salminicola]|nr:hypothetical protein HZS_3899 [Henneguya salminicola]